jgi:hypothetical protein
MRLDECPDQCPTPKRSLCNGLPIDSLGPDPIVRHWQIKITADPFIPLSVTLSLNVPSTPSLGQVQKSQVETDGRITTSKEQCRLASIRAAPAAGTFK